MCKNVRKPVLLGGAAQVLVTVLTATLLGLCFAGRNMLHQGQHEPFTDWTQDSWRNNKLDKRVMIRSLAASPTKRLRNAYLWDLHEMVKNQTFQYRGSGGHIEKVVILSACDIRCMTKLFTIWADGMKSAKTQDGTYDLMQHALIVCHGAMAWFYCTTMRDNYNHTCALDMPMYKVDHATFGTPQYVTNTMTKIRWMRAVVDLGVTVFWVDMDIYVQRNPLPVFFEYPQVDLFIQSEDCWDFIRKMQKPSPIGVKDNYRFNRNTGVGFYRASPKMSQFMEFWLEYMIQADPTLTRTHDQHALQPMLMLGTSHIMLSNGSQRNLDGWYDIPKQDHYPMFNEFQWNIPEASNYSKYVNESALNRWARPKPNATTIRERYAVFNTTYGDWKEGLWQISRSREVVEYMLPMTVFNSFCGHYCGCHPWTAPERNFTLNGTHLECPHLYQEEVDARYTMHANCEGRLDIKAWLMDIARNTKGTRQRNGNATG